MQDTDEIIEIDNLEQLTPDSLIHKLMSSVDDSINSWNQLPSPYDMLNMDIAVNRFIQAINTNQRILFVHDSDADGIGTYMLSYIFFQKFIYNNIEIIITDRSRGYGFVPSYITERQGTQNLPNLVITADNGITSHAACDLCKSLGIDVIITDHHQVDQHEGIPDAIIVDPHQPNCPFPYKDINGTFVYWYFLKAIRDISNTPIDMIEEFLPELCLTTISDVMPLIHINRFVVKEGLQRFNIHHRQWVRTFVEVFKKPNITAEDLAFNLIPAINATGRLTRAEESACFLAATDRKTSLDWFTYIKSLNDIRKNKQENLLTTIYTKYDAWTQYPFIAIPGDNFEKGLLGPCASKLADRYKKPAIVFSLNKDKTMYSGSGRAYGQIDILQLVKNNPYVIQNKTGGHKQACGVSVMVENWEKFWQTLQQDTIKLSSELYKDSTKTAIGHIDLRYIDYELFKKIDFFQPFGQGFRNPLLQSTVTIKELKTMGKEKNHYNMVVTDGMCEIRAIQFFFNDKLEKNATYNIVYSLNEDTYAGNENIVLQIKDAIKI
ncbi:MAG: DHH family phosphoesterase [Sphaerochaeta sp.]|jgi:single-stranded-DNA-specific exonuclease